MSERPRAGKARTLLLGALGFLVVALLGALSPWAYDRMRCELLLRRLERAEDLEARRELANPRYAERVWSRMSEAGRGKGEEDKARRFAQPLIDLASRGEIEPRARRDAFDICFPARFDEGPWRGSGAGLGRLGPGDTQLYTLRANGMLSEFVDASAWQETLYRVAAPQGGGVQEYVEYFLQGKGAGARLVFLRASWVIFPPDAKSIRERIRVETEDLTDVPDPLNFYLAPPVSLMLPGGVPALELRMAVMGPWRQFVPGLRLLDRSVSYGISLDRSRSTEGAREPFLLGSIAVAGGRWFAEDAVLEKPLATFASGPHWLSFRLPQAAAKLQPLDKVKFLFRPDPGFAQKNGFHAAAADSPPFEREYYVPGSPLPARK